MARFYTNPFVKDAPMVAAVEVSPETYDGLTHTGEGTFQTWSRTVKYADGTERHEQTRCHSLGERLRWDLILAPRRRS